MGVQDTKGSIKWQALLSTWQDLKAELLQQQAALRTERSAALVDFALDKTPENRAKLDDLNTHLASIHEILTDLEVIIAEVERQAEQAAGVLHAEPPKEILYDAKAAFS